MKILLSSAYLAPIQYYALLFVDNPVFIEKYENYIKQTYRNRVIIISANGPLSLSIPIESMNGNKCLMKDIRIAEHGNWQHIHWNAIVSAYHSTPFFEYYEDYFNPFYGKKYKYLFDFNEELRGTICMLLDIDNSKIRFTEEYVSNTDGYIDFRNSINPKIHVNINWFNSIQYYQVFEKKYGFIENLSILDLLFNMGNESQIILGKSIKNASNLIK